MANSTRLWYNHGYTPMELSKLNPYDLNNLTVVPGSSNAAKLLDESRDQLRQIGIHVDLDANATERYCSVSYYTRDANNKEQSKGTLKVKFAHLVQNKNLKNANSTDETYCITNQ